MNSTSGTLQKPDIQQDAGILSAYPSQRSAARSTVKKAWPLAMPDTKGVRECAEDTGVDWYVAMRPWLGIG